MGGRVLLQLVTATFLLSFVHSVLYYHVEEERDEQHVWIGNVARDSNLSSIVGEEGMLTMKYNFIESGSQHMDKFSIDSQSGILTTNARLNRETLCRFNRTCEIKLKVAAIGGSTVIAIEVRVIVDDINDNAPVFKPTTMSLQISEGSTVQSKFKIVGATDEDMVGNNSLKGYELRPPSEYFQLIIEDEKPDGSSDVSLKLIKGLDRETQDSHQVFVIAKDGGDPPKTGMLTVDITVTDINDNNPKFSQNEYQVTVEEDLPVNSNILQVKADDKDIGSNGQVEYQFSDRVSGNFKDYFSINRVSGNITLIKQLEYTKGNSYRIVVLASDKGNPSNSEQAVVIVKVKDTNNNAPQIKINLLTGKDSTEVKENTPKDSVIAHVEAVDGDTGENGKVQCFIDNPLFVMKELEKNVFIIMVDTLLDREDRIEHVIKIFCMDGGSPSQNSTASFSVQVMDVNDNPPEFTNTIYRVSVSENAAVPSRIAKVSAMDRDQEMNAKVKYHLEPAARSKFSMEANSGIILALVPFDREQQSHLDIIVYAVDSGKPENFTATATVAVTITDENDNSPKFAKDIYEFNLQENLSSTTFGNVTATDADALDNGRVTYSIPPQYVTTPFTVLPSGELLTHKPLDREEKDRYDFVIMARDSGLHSRNSTVNVTIHITDVNDNRPTIKFPNETNSTVYLSYLAEPQSLVTTVVAEDRDAGQNSEINFVILTGDDNKLFQLDYNSGEILLRRKIRIHEIRLYTLHISAEDNGNPQLTTQRPINIQVEFVNITVTQPQVDGANNNMLIAIAIACITFVFSTVIIITICIIRKMDAKKRNYGAKNTEEMKIIETMGRGSNRSSQSSKGSKDIFIPPPPYPTDKVIKKEVSFSLDDEQDSGLMTFSIPPSVASSNMVTFKSNASMMDDPASRQIMEKPHISHSRDSSVSDTKHKEVNRMASLRVQQQLLQSQEPPHKNWKSRPHSSELKHLSNGIKDRHQDPHDDNHSDLSGESTTSDSGRGGSEEDLRNAGLPHLHLERSPDSRNFSTTTDSSGVSSQASSAINRPVFTTFGHKDNRQSPVNGGLSTFPRNSSSKSEASGEQPTRQNHHQHPIFVRPGVQRLNSDNIHHPHHKRQYRGDIPRAHSETRNRSDIPRVPSESPQNIPRVTVDPRTNRLLLSPVDKNLQRSNRLPNLTNSYDDSLSESCAREDDDVTTTSGSYTVNAEELCSEIDELFFKKPTDTVV